MPHPYLHRASTERGRRNIGRHGGSREAFNPVFQDQSQEAAGSAPERRPDDAGSAPESGETPERLTPDAPKRR